MITSRMSLRLAAVGLVALFVTAGAVHSHYAAAPARTNTFKERFVSAVIQYTDKVTHVVSYSQPMEGTLALNAMSNARAVETDLVSRVFFEGSKEYDMAIALIVAEQQKLTASVKKLTPRERLEDVFSTFPARPKTPPEPNNLFAKDTDNVG